METEMHTESGRDELTDIGRDAEEKREKSIGKKEGGGVKSLISGVAVSLDFCSLISFSLISEFPTFVLFLLQISPWSSVVGARRGASCSILAPASLYAPPVASSNPLTTFNPRFLHPMAAPLAPSSNPSAHPLPLTGKSTGQRSKSKQLPPELAYLMLELPKSAPWYPRSPMANLARVIGSLSLSPPVCA